MLTKKDLKEEIASLRKEFKKDLEDAIAQIMESIMKWGTGLATKEDLKSFTTKDDLNDFKEEVRGEFKEVKRHINDLKADLPTPQEFAGHEKRIANLETAVFPQ